jgi:hypothetical protein
MFDRIVCMPIITQQSPQAGLRDAIRSLTGDYREIDWQKRTVRGQYRSLWQDILVATSGMPENGLFFAQTQTRGVLQSSLLNRIRGVKVVWGGDLRATIQPWMREVGPHVLTLLTNWRDVDELRRMKYKADYLQVGFSPTVFNPDGPQREGTPEIVAMMNHYDTFPQSKLRKDTVNALRQRYGDNFAIYGSGWDGGAKWLNEADEAAAYRSCKIAIGIENYADVRGFCSDRSFRVTGSGACYLPHKFVAFDEHFVDGKEAVSWTTHEDLFEKIDYLLANDDERQRIASEGCLRAHLDHSWAARMPRLLELIEQHMGVAA